MEKYLDYIDMAIDRTSLRIKRSSWGNQDPVDVRQLRDFLFRRLSFLLEARKRQQVGFRMSSFRKEPLRKIRVHFTAYFPHGGYCVPKYPVDSSQYNRVVGILMANPIAMSMLSRLYRMGRKSGSFFIVLKDVNYRRYCILNTMDFGTLEIFMEEI